MKMTTSIILKKPMMNIEMHATLVHENEESYPLLVNQLDRSTKRDLATAIHMK